MTHNPSLRNTTPFAVIVRDALDELDGSPAAPYWTVIDANKLAEAIVIRMTAQQLADAEAEFEDIPL